MPVLVHIRVVAVVVCHTPGCHVIIEHLHGFREVCGVVMPSTLVVESPRTKTRWRRRTADKGQGGVSVRTVRAVDAPEGAKYSNASSTLQSGLKFGFNFTITS